MNIFKNKLLKGDSRAFTLIELLVVISIIGFLSSIVIASMQTARDKAVTAKITEDLRQVQIAAELAYGENGNYIFITHANLDENILANSGVMLEDNNSFFIKTANAIETIPPACNLFNNIVLSFVNKKYIASVPVHPKQDYSKSICYKAATSTDGSYFTAYTETPAEFVIGSTPTPKNVGFVVGNTSITNLDTIRITTRDSGSGRGYLQTTNNQSIGTFADIADEVIGVTSGLAANYGTLGGSGGGGGTGGGVTATTSNQTAFRQDVEKLISALELYKADHGYYPGQNKILDQTKSTQLYYSRPSNLVQFGFDSSFNFENELVPQYISKLPTSTNLYTFIYYRVKTNYVSGSKCDGDTQTPEYLIKISEAEPGFEDWPYAYNVSTPNYSYRCFSL